jgi:predicted transcriptional regulator of viral defense system
MGAILACGPRAYLSHRSAAALYGIAKARGRIEVAVTRRGEHRRRGVKVHMRPSLPSHDAGTLEEIPVTSPVRTLLDLATLEPPNRVERAVGAITAPRRPRPGTRCGFSCTPPRP